MWEEWSKIFFYKLKRWKKENKNKIVWVKMREKTISYELLEKSFSRKAIYKLVK